MQGFLKYTDKPKYGDTVIVYINYNCMYPVKLVEGKVFQSKYGALKHSDIIAKPFGSTVQCTKGFVHILFPTSELWTISLPHRTQIIYTRDISFIVFQLDLKPGSVVCESGTGSGSLTHALARVVAPSGCVYTFDFHEQRSITAREEFDDHGLGNIVQVEHRDVCTNGFSVEGKADAVFLDLPHPWLVVEHAIKALKSQAISLMGIGLIFVLGTILIVEFTLGVEISNRAKVTVLSESKGNALADLARNDTIDLFLGIPGIHPPHFLLKYITNAINGKESLYLSQYVGSLGLPRLRKALANYYSPKINHTIDENREVLVTIGASEAIPLVLLSLTNPGDEVILFQPAYSPYESAIRLVGGVPVYVPLKRTIWESPTLSSHYTFNRSDLKKAFSNKTKLIFVNNPMNPIGKVFTREELEFIAALCKKHNVVVVSDEVYESMIYPGVVYTRMASLANMWENTITISSSSKIWSVTGWRVGWMYGPSKYILAAKDVHSISTYCVASMSQEALAIAFEREIELSKTGKKTFFEEWAEMLLQKRDYLVKALRKSGFDPIVPQGAYYVCNNFSSLVSNVTEIDGKTDYPVAEWLVSKHNLLLQPVGLFVQMPSSQSDWLNVMRMCFIKPDKTLRRVKHALDEM